MFPDVPSNLTTALSVEEDILSVLLSAISVKSLFKSFNAYAITYSFSSISSAE
jgi:hypothetical protein